MKTLPGRGGLLRLRPLTAADLRRHDLGRSSRQPSTALHAHHIVYWADGGRTDLDNLILVCSRHHTLIHTQGFRLVLHADRRLEATTAHDVPLLHHPAQRWEDPAALATGCGRDVAAGTLPPDDLEPRLDLGYVVSVLVAQAS